VVLPQALPGDHSASHSSYIFSAKELRPAVASATPTLFVGLKPPFNQTGRALEVFLLRWGPTW